MTQPPRLAVRLRCSGDRRRCRRHVADVLAYPDGKVLRVQTSQRYRDQGMPMWQASVDIATASWDRGYGVPWCQKDGHDTMYLDKGRRGEQAYPDGAVVVAAWRHFWRTGRVQEVFWRPGGQEASWRPDAQ